MQKAVHQSLVENKSPVEDWTSEQVACWLIHVGFDKELADNFKGKTHSKITPMIINNKNFRSGNKRRHFIRIDSGLIKRTSSDNIW